MAQQFERIVKTSNSRSMLNMKTNRLTTTTQIAAISFALTSAIYIGHLNRKTQLTPHQARTHQVLLDTYKAASRALLFPALPPAAPPSRKSKQRKLSSKSDQTKN